MQLTARIHFQTFAVPRRAFALLLGVIAAGVLSSCAFLRPHADPTQFYVLTQPDAPVRSAAAGGFARWKIGLRSIELPAYLHNKLMVVRTGANEIQFAEFDRWAEPLDDGISRLMKETLGAAGKVESVTLNSHGEDTLDYEVRLGILACEGRRGDSGTGSIRFVMSWEIRSVGTNSPMVKGGTFAASPGTWDGKNYGALALGLSEAIAAGGKMLAAELPAEAASAKPANGHPAKP